MTDHRWEIPEFGRDHLAWREFTPDAPGPGEVLLHVHAASLNYRDLLVIGGSYNPRLKLPAVPVSDGAGVIEAVGDGVTEFAPGDEVMTNFCPAWRSGRFRDARWLKSTLGTPGPGLAATRVVLSTDAVAHKPASLGMAEAATLTCSGLTVWDSLVTVTDIDPAVGAADRTVLAIGTGGVGINTVQFAKLLGARAIIISSSDEKLDRARELGADVGINYRTHPDWEKEVLAATDGLGADIIVDTGGTETLPRCVRCARAGGFIAVLGALTGLDVTLNTGLIMMKRITLAGVMTGCHAVLEEMLQYLGTRHPDFRPVIDRRFPFADFPAALDHMKAGAHIGKIVLEG